MLRFFRINDPYRLVFIFLLLVLIRFGQSYFVPGTSYFELKHILLGQWLDQGFSLYSQAFDYTGPIAAFLYKYIDLVFGRSIFVHHALSTILITVQAGIFNQLLLKNKAYNENSYVPAFLYMILMACLPDFMALSPQLLSLTFILLAFRNVLRRIDNQVTDELFLNSGVFIGIATMIYLPAAVYYFVFLISLILFSSAVARRLLLYTFGFFITFALCGLFFYWNGSLDLFIQDFVVKSITMESSSLMDLRTLMILSAPFLFLFLISVVKTWGAARLTNYQQKIQQVIWLMFFGGIAAAMLSNEKVGYEMVFAVPVIAYFWTHYFVLLRRRFFVALMPIILIFGMIGFNVYAYQNFLNVVSVEPVSQIEDKTLIIGERLDFYVEQEMNTPCFNKQLCQDEFGGLNYYQNAIRLYEIIQQVDPDIIVDDLNVASNLFHRFPILQKKYRQISNNRFQKINN